MKKYLAIILAATIVAAVFAGCTPTSTTPGAGASQPANTASEPTTGTGTKQIVLGLNADYITFDPAHAYEKSSRQIFRAVYDTLITFDPSDVTKPIGNIAKDWTISEDGKVYTFNLNADIKFSTGNTLTSKDVKWNFERLASVKGNPSFLAENIVSVEAPEDAKVVITLKEVDPSFLTKLSDSGFTVTDSTYIQANCPDEVAIEKFLMTQSAGSGPYTIATFELNNELILERNPNYTRTATPIDRYVFKHVSDPGTQLMSLQKGDLDFALDLEDTQIQTLKADTKIQFVDVATVDIFFFMMNADPTIGGPLANEKVREAIGYAFDYEGARQLAGGAAITPYSIIPNGFLGDRQDLANTKIRDIEKAKALLKEAGYEQGFEIKCGYIPDMAPDGVSFSTMAEKLQADMAEVGITITLVPEQVSVFLDNYRGGKHQMNVNMWGPDYPDSMAQIPFLPGETVGLRANWTKESNPELAALAAKIKIETDDTARATLLKEAQDKMQNGPFLVYLQPGRTLACSTRITNIYFSPAFNLELRSMDIVA